VLEIKRKDGESFESFIRRFSKKTLQSGKIIQAKKIRFFQKPLSHLAKQQRAKKRDEMKKKREYLRKIGKLDEMIQSGRGRKTMRPKR